MQDVFDPRRFASHPVAALLLSTHARTNAILQSALEGEDKAALRGLAQNHTLPAPYLDRVERRLHELGAKYDAWEARQRLKDIHEAPAPEDPDELFGEEGKQGGFLEGKVNFIGKKLIATPMKQRIREATNNRTSRHSPGPRAAKKIISYTG